MELMRESHIERTPNSKRWTKCLWQLYKFSYLQIPNKKLMIHINPALRWKVTTFPTVSAFFPQVGQWVWGKLVNGFVYNSPRAFGGDVGGLGGKDKKTKRQKNKKTKRQKNKKTKRQTKSFWGRWWGSGR